MSTPIYETYWCDNGCIAGFALLAIVFVVLSICAIGLLCNKLHPFEEEDSTPIIKKQEQDEEAEQELHKASEHAPAVTEVSPEPATAAEPTA
jgi:hypothetical protein